MNNWPEYQRKPTKVKAIRFSSHMSPWPECVNPEHGVGYASIRTAIGHVRVNDGDWIVEDENMRVMVVTDSIFKLRFETATNSPNTKVLPNVGKADNPNRRKKNDIATRA